jgi:hypothetical protein
LFDLCVPLSEEGRGCVARLNIVALPSALDSPFAGLLLPSLFVHAEHEEPHDQPCCPEEAEGCNVGE